VRGGRSVAPLPSYPARSSPTSLIFCGARVFSAWSRRVAAVAEWALGFRVVMAGYEYVSPEQLAGFDKYKVVRVGGPPSPPSPRPRPGGGGRRRGPCHLVPDVWLRACWRQFLRGPASHGGLRSGSLGKP
jgi:hypothetical protein